MLTCCLFVWAACHVTSHQNVLLLRVLQGYPYQPTRILMTYQPTRYIIYICTYYSILINQRKSLQWYITSILINQPRSFTKRGHRSLLICSTWLAGHILRTISRSKWVIKNHQEFQVPEMEGFLNLIRLFWGMGFPYISRIHRAYIGFCTSILGTTSMFGERIFHQFSTLFKKMYGWPRHARPWD